MIEVRKNRTLLENVSHISGEYVITKSGAVFRLNDSDGLTVEAVGGKTKVHDEWLAD